MYASPSSHISRYHDAHLGSFERHSAQIFASGTDATDLHELAAFLGHTLHESGDFVYPREIGPCGTNSDVSGVTYCSPAGASGTYSDPYCSSAHTSTSDPDGCDCGPVGETPDGYEANKLFFGRGPIQLR